MKTLRDLALLLAACAGATHAQTTVQDEADAKLQRSAGPRKPDLGLHAFDLAAEKLSPQEKARHERIRLSRV